MTIQYGNELKIRTGSFLKKKKFQPLNPNEYMLKLSNNQISANQNKNEIPMTLTNT